MRCVWKCDVVVFLSKEVRDRIEGIIEVALTATELFKQSEPLLVISLGGDLEGIREGIDFYFSLEKSVAVRYWLSIALTSFPFTLDAAKTACHLGSAMNAFQLAAAACLFL